MGAGHRKQRDILTCPISQLAAQIIALHALSPAQARNAYSGLILIPGFDQLRFSALLSKCKKLWSESNVRYGAFWDGQDVLQKVLQDPLDWHSVAAVRGRLIICLRLLQLTRSIDLAQCLRTTYQVGTAHYLLLKRKGSPRPQWEEVVDGGLPAAVNPW